MKYAFIPSSIYSFMYSQTLDAYLMPGTMLVGVIR